MALWAIPRTSIFRQGIRVLDEGTQDELFRFGCDAIPQPNDTIEYDPIMGSVVTYKVESIKYVVKADLDSPDFESYVAVGVSVV